MEKELTKEQAKALFASVDFDLDKLSAQQAAQVMTALFGKSEERKREVYRNVNKETKKDLKKIDLDIQSKRVARENYLINNTRFSLALNKESIEYLARLAGLHLAESGKADFSKNVGKNNEYAPSFTYQEQGGKELMATDLTHRLSLSFGSVKIERQKVPENDQASFREKLVKDGYATKDKNGHIHPVVWEVNDKLDKKNKLVDVSFTPTEIKKK